MCLWRGHRCSIRAAESVNRFRDMYAYCYVRKGRHRHTQTQREGYTCNRRGSLHQGMEPEIMDFVNGLNPSREQSETRPYPIYARRGLLRSCPDPESKNIAQNFIRTVTCGGAKNMGTTNHPTTPGDAPQAVWQVLGSANAKKQNGCRTTPGDALQAARRALGLVATKKNVEAIY